MVVLTPNFKVFCVAVVSKSIIWYLSSVKRSKFKLGDMTFGFLVATAVDTVAYLAGKLPTYTCHHCS